MSLPFEKRQEIITCLLREIKNNNGSPVQSVSNKFGISRQTVYKYITKLIDDGYILATKNGYLLKTKEYNTMLALEGLEEDTVWRKEIFPLIKGLPKNVIMACNYGFTEILNNAIDHSDSQYVYIYYEEDAISIEFTINDEGIGIFRKIQVSLGLEDQKHAILELAKGKLTTDPTRHSGEGIFFTSRIFDEFIIMSGNLNFVSGRKKEADYLFENTVEETKGTSVSMLIKKDSDVIIKEVFDNFTAKNDDSYGFSKTHIPVRLVECEGSDLVSRSQAKRLIRRFDRFMEVILDFKDINEIGQAFADELFRVFKLDHPNVELIPINMSKDVEKMVYRAIFK